MKAAVFQGGRKGVLPAPVRTRYGFHVVALDQRVPGRSVPFEAVRERIAAQLVARVQENAPRQYVQVLAGRAGEDTPAVAAAWTPLVR